MDVYIRMYAMHRLNAKNADFGKLFHEVSMTELAQAKKERRKEKPLSLNVRHRRFATPTFPHKKGILVHSGAILSVFLMFYLN